MHPQNDIRAVRAVGGIALLLGTVLMPITIVTPLYFLFVSGGQGDLGRGAIAFATSLIMASTLLGCGTQLARRGIFFDVDSIRLSWSALMVVMVLGGLIGYWFFPPLTSLAAFVVILLILIRGAVIRLSRQGL